MAVSIADLVAVSVKGSVVTSLTTGSMAITSNPNRAGVLCLFSNQSTISSITGSIGGVSAVAISGTDLSSSGWRVLMYGVTAPPSGSQTATMSWTTSADAILGAVVTSGVDQTTPFNNGNTASGGSGSSTISCTSTNGDLTVDLVVANTSTVGTPSQTSLWSQSSTSPAFFAGGSRGPGTGNTTHAWTISGNTIWLANCCNFKQAIVGSASIAAAKVTSRNVGPQALRYLFRQPSQSIFGGPILDPPGYIIGDVLVSNRYVGPPALYYLRKQPVYPLQMFGGRVGAILQGDQTEAGSSGEVVTALLLSQSDQVEAGTGADVISSALVDLGDIVEYSSGAYGLNLPDVVLYQGQATPDDVTLRNPNVTVSIGLQDSVVGAVSYSSTETATAEVGASADAPGSSIPAQSDIVDAGSVADVVGSSIFAKSDIVEAGTVADVVTSLLLDRGDIIEVGSGIDVVGGAWATSGTISEAGSASDIVTGPFVAVGDQVENGTASEIVTALLLSQSDQVEAGTGADAPGASFSIICDTPESIGFLTKSITDVFLYQAEANQNDIRLRNPIRQVVIGGMIDAPSAFGFGDFTVVEVGASLDAVTGLPLYAGDITEAGTLADLISSILVLLGDIVDTKIAAQDVTSLFEVFQGDVVEIDPAFDSTAAGLQSDIVEAGSAADVISGMVGAKGDITESGSAADSISSMLLAVGALAEIVSASDTVSSILVAVGTIAEVGNAGDIPTALLVDAGTISETGAAADVSSGALFRAAAISEIGSATEVISSSLFAVGSVLEIGSASDTISGTLFLTADLLEAGFGLDVLSGALVSLASVIEAGLAVDVTAVVSLFAGDMTEILSALDVNSAFLSTIISESGALLDITDSIILANIRGRIVLSDAAQFAITLTDRVGGTRL